MAEFRIREHVNYFDGVPVKHYTVEELIPEIRKDDAGRVLTKESEDWDAFYTREAEYWKQYPREFGTSSDAKNAVVNSEPLDNYSAIVDTISI